MRGKNFIKDEQEITLPYFMEEIAVLVQSFTFQVFFSGADEPGRRGVSEERYLGSVRHLSFQEVGWTM